MKKVYIIILFLILILAISGYVWFGYATVYNRISDGGLSVVDNQYVYTINPMGEQKIKYAALGDSLTAGVGATKYENSYPYLLAQKMTEQNKKVVLSDFSLLGARAEDVIHDLLGLAINETPDVVTVLIGVNDVREKTSEQDFKNNYQQIVNGLVNQTEAKIYLISIPFIGSNTVYLPGYDVYFRQRTVAFNQIIQEIALAQNIKYIDIATPTEKVFKTDGPHYSVDSFHPSDSGYNIIMQQIYDRFD